MTELRIDQILFIQAQGNYLYIHFAGNKPKELIRSTLKKMESQCMGTTLIRVHNSYLANLVKAIKLQSSKLYFNSKYTSFSIPVSRKYIKQVRQHLKSLLDSQEQIVYTANDPGYPF